MTKGRSGPERAEKRAEKRAGTVGGAKKEGGVGNLLASYPIRVARERQAEEVMGLAGRVVGTGKGQGGRGATRGAVMAASV